MSVLEEPLMKVLLQLRRKSPNFINASYDFLAGQHSQGFIRLMNALKSSLCICGLAVLLRAFSFYWTLIASHLLRNQLSPQGSVKFILLFLFLDVSGASAVLERIDVGLSGV